MVTLNSKNDDSSSSGSTLRIPSSITTYPRKNSMPNPLSIFKSSGPNCDQPWHRCVRVLLLGDINSGKSSLLLRMFYNAVHDPIPTIICDPGFTTTIDGREWRASLLDPPFTTYPPPSKQLDPEIRLLPSSLSLAEVTLLCFAVNNRVSLEHACGGWKALLGEYSPGTPVVLVGLKTDLRDGTSVDLEDMVSAEEGCEAASKIGAVTYIECCSHTGHCIQEVKKAAISGSIAYDRYMHKWYRKKQPGCAIL